MVTAVSPSSWKAEVINSYVVFDERTFGKPHSWRTETGQH